MDNRKVDEIIGTLQLYVGIWFGLTILLWLFILQHTFSDAAVTALSIMLIVRIALLGGGHGLK